MRATSLFTAGSALDGGGTRAQQTGRGSSPPETLPKKLHIKTFGCQMNAYDSERMAEALAPAGLRSDRRSGRGRPRHSQYLPHQGEGGGEGLFRARPRARWSEEERRRQGRDTLIAVAGCVAQAEGREILARAHVVDIVVGPQSYHRFGALVAEACQRPARACVATDFPAEDKFAQLPERPRGRVQISAFVTVQEGCDKFCTFCVVPYTRGAEFSRSAAEIVAEVERLAENGHARDHPARAERQRLSWRMAPTARDWTLARAAAAARRGATNRAAPLHHEPSARHGRRSDRSYSPMSRSSCPICTSRSSPARTASSRR